MGYVEAGLRTYDISSPYPEEFNREASITMEHVQNNSTVREMLGQRGIRPEDLPASEDIKKLERRVKSQEKKIASQSAKLPSEEKKIFIYCRYLKNFMAYIKM